MRFFCAVLLTPPATTWSRLWHCDNSRTGTFAHSRFSCRTGFQKKVNDANRCMEITAWFAEQSLLCSARLVALLFVFPEIFGGHHRDGPASPWALQEWRQLQSVDDARRGAAFLCRLAESEYRRPLGFLSNFLQPTLRWVAFLFFRETITCIRRCLAQEVPGHSAHQTFKRFDGGERFHFFFNGIEGLFPSGHGYCRRLQSSSFTTALGMAAPMSV